MEWNYNTEPVNRHLEMNWFRWKWFIEKVNRDELGVKLICGIRRRDFGSLIILPEHSNYFRFKQESHTRWHLSSSSSSSSSSCTNFRASRILCQADCTADRCRISCDVRQRRSLQWRASPYDRRNISVFSALRNWSRDDEDVIDGGRLFHTFAAAKGKATDSMNKCHTLAVIHQRDTVALLSPAMSHLQDGCCHLQSHQHRLSREPPFAD